MDNNKVSVATFNKLASHYQNKYMNFKVYLDTYDQILGMLPKPNASILEVGCGPGNVSRYLLSQMPQLKIHGIDLAPQMIELAKLNNPNATYEVKDCREISFENKKFDVVLCAFCTPYLNVKELQLLLSSLQTIINANGYVYISTMEGSDKDSGLQTSSNGDQIFIYYHQYEVIADSLLANNFTIVSIQRKTTANFKEPNTDLFIIAKAN